MHEIDLYTSIHGPFFWQSLSLSLSLSVSAVLFCQSSIFVVFTNYRSETVILKRVTSNSKTLCTINKKLYSVIIDLP